MTEKANYLIDDQEYISSKIWEEKPESDNPFAASICYCHGYDVYGDLLGKISWSEYIYLLFTGERPSEESAQLLEKLAIAVANPGARDPSIRAAMNGGVGGSQPAASLMSALAVGAGQLGGAHEVAIAMKYWQELGQSLSNWKERLINPIEEVRADVWLPMEHAPGFDPNGVSCGTPVKRCLNLFSSISSDKALSWLEKNRLQLEEIVGYPLAMTGVVAAAFTDLGLTTYQGEMLYLLLRLPGAAVHAIEQEANGWRNYPSFVNAVELTNDPGDRGSSHIEDSL